MTECVADDATGDRHADEEAVASAVERIRERGATVRDQQVDRALSELDGVSERERAEIESLADRLVERLLAVPEEQLRRAAREGNEDRFRRALELFG